MVGSLPGTDSSARGSSAGSSSVACEVMLLRRDGSGMFLALSRPGGGRTSGGSNCDAGSTLEGMGETGGI